MNPHPFSRQSARKNDAFGRHSAKNARPATGAKTKAAQQKPLSAVVYCEANFAKIDGKTANGIVRHSQMYRICSVIDGAWAGLDSGVVLDDAVNNIPIVADLETALKNESSVPDTLIYGMAPASGRLSAVDRKVVLDAISRGMNIVSGLHEYLGDDPEIADAASAANVSVRDIRKPRPTKDMRLFDGSVGKTKAIRIAVLGTDCAIGKRTTATILAKALNELGVRTVLVGTGQTGLMQGARYGVALDAVPPQFCCGELERVVVAASEQEQPDVILIEGQGALSHPAFCTSAFILRGCQPDAVIVQHAPNRPHRCDFPAMAMPDPLDEVKLIEAFAKTKVIGLTINHEGMMDGGIDTATQYLSRALDVPVTDALARPEGRLTDMVLAAFPALRLGTTVAAA